MQRNTLFNYVSNNIHTHNNQSLTCCWYICTLVQITQEEDEKKDKAEDMVVDANDGTNRMASFTL